MNLLAHSRVHCMVASPTNGGFVKEIWKKTTVCNFIEASSFGNVRRLTDTKNGRYQWAIGRQKKGYIYSPIIKNGYLAIRVSDGGSRKQLLVSRLVCDAFYGAAPEGNYHAAHKDGNPLNNKKDNLYWATPAQNIADRERHGKTMRGDSHYNRKLSSKDVKKIRIMLNSGESQHAIAEKFNVTNHTICDINRRKSWKHV